MNPPKMQKPMRDPPSPKKSHGAPIPPPLPPPPPPPPTIIVVGSTFDLTVGGDGSVDDSPTLEYDAAYFQIVQSRVQIDTWIWLWSLKALKTTALTQLTFSDTSEHGTVQLGNYPSYQIVPSVYEVSGTISISPPDTLFNLGDEILVTVIYNGPTDPPQPSLSNLYAVTPTVNVGPNTYQFTATVTGTGRTAITVPSFPVGNGMSTPLGTDVLTFVPLAAEKLVVSAPSNVRWQQ